MFEVLLFYLAFNSAFVANVFISSFVANVFIVSFKPDSLTSFFLLSLHQGYYS